MIDWQSKVVAPCAAAFGQSAALTWNDQVFQIPDGVFDEAYSQTDVADGMPITTVSPCLGINTAEINLGGQPLSALQGARVTVQASAFPGGAPAASTNYIVREARADGHGWALLMLDLVPTSGDEPPGGGQDA